jgi:hypothetical protein
MKTPKDTIYTYRSAQGMRAMPLSAKHAASPRVSVESPIKAMGPRINSQLSLLENKSSELTHTSCMRLCGGGGDEEDGDVTVMMGMFFCVLDRNRQQQRFHEPRVKQQKKLRGVLLLLSSPCSNSDDPNSVEKVGRLRRMIAEPRVGWERIQDEGEARYYRPRA